MLALILLSATFSRPLERVSTMDPAFAQSVYDSHAIQLVYETPLEVDYQARPYRLKRGFCELPKVSEDGKTYTFRLAVNDEARGKLGARDMESSLRRLMDPKLVSPNGWIMKDVEEIKALDDKTIEVRLKRRVHYFPWLMAMSPTAIRGPKGEGSGRYQLTEWRKNHEMTFCRASKDNSEGFDTVCYLVVDDVSTQWLMFLKGELDYLGEISRDNFDSIFSADGKLNDELIRRGIKLHTYTSMDVMHIGFNMNDTVVGSNRLLRQALTLAFDRQNWENFYARRVIAADGPVPPGVEGRLETKSEFEFNLPRAMEMMTRAGYPNGVDGKTGRRLTLRLAIGRASQASREQGELLSAFFEKVGVRLELDFMTWDAFLTAVNEGRTQMFSMGWVGDYPDAQNFLQLFYSKNLSPGPNHSNYINHDFDKEYEAALDSTTTEERNRHWIRCQEIVREDCPWIFTHYNRAFTLTGPHVENYLPSVFPYGNESQYRYLP